MVEGTARKRPAVVLLSGGLDSATTLAIAVARGFEVHALTVRYGQRHAIEIDRARSLASSLGAAHHGIVDVDLGLVGGSALTDPSIPVPEPDSEREIGERIPSTYVPARNTVFLSLALAWAETRGACDLFVGVNAVDYSGYPDCRPEFLEAFESLANVATRAGVEGRRFRLHAPLLRFDKARIVRKAVELGVDLASTISCYAPDSSGGACRACEACILRARGFREAGIEDPALID
jgi:7-cyano-7-deazaguanine synthase